MRIPLAAAAVSALLSLFITSSYAQVVVPSSEIAVTVVDQSGARIPGSELVFQDDAKPIMARADSEGAATVPLPTGRYTVTASHSGFLKNEMPDFQVVAPQPDELKIVLKVGWTDMVCTLPCGNFAIVNLEVSTITSDVPGVIPPDPPAEPEIRKSRSWHCLYLWKCASP